MKPAAVNRIYYHCIFFFEIYFLCLLLFFASRLFYAFNVLGAEEIKNNFGDCVKAILVGIRFDTVTICYSMLLPFLIGAITIFTGRFDSYIRRFLLIYFTLMLLVFLFFSVVDFYYYTYFQSHINILIFGFFEDDTKAVMKSLWTDYPLLWVLLGLLLFAFLFFQIIKRIQGKIFSDKEIQSGKVSVFFPIFFTVLLVFGLRSSFGTFPVQIDDASVSSNAKINLLPVNGVFAFKDAWVYHSQSMNMDSYIAQLKEMGFENKESAFNNYFHLQNAKQEDWNKFLFTNTDSNEYAKRNPPHVVFFLMESMSNSNLYLHSKEINLLGHLEKYWNTDIVFRNFFSNHNGTIGSLEGLMVNTPVSSLAQSKYAGVTFNSSSAKPFLENGYETTFITGGKITWRNINNFVPHQYFLNVEGDVDIMKSVKGAAQCEWGVYDEFLMQHVFNKLKNSNGKPQFIFALTTTNHTPFHLPDNYKPYPVDLDNELKGKIKVDETIARNNLTNLQYSNDCLGRFLDSLENSPYANNTIVIATGDHNNLMLFDFSEEQAFYHYSVPLFIHSPKEYLKNSEVDVSRWGSHKDVFPTIFNLALDSAKYFKGGNNLLKKSDGVESFDGVNIMGWTAMNKSGAVFFDGRQKYFLKDDKNNLRETQRPDSALSSLMQKAKAYYGVMLYNLYDEVNAGK
jgi:phosphoglycerol transferase MdoB-like AlkP superfamily enzyme